jgi:hypothetical protein
VLFLLGTHQPQWLGRTSVPLFISHRRLMKRKTLPRALGPWALDSGGFSELSMFGEWRTTAWEYAWAVRRYMIEIGRLVWAAIQDWMCEPFALKRTGYTVEEHQRRTVGSYLDLRGLAPDLPWAPVLQGWAPDDYLRHVELYDRAGVDLGTLAVVGLGSVCRRSQTDEIVRLVYRLSDLGIRLHGFGVKTEGLRSIAHRLVSADSMAWSFQARRAKRRLDGCVGHQNCANCARYALVWRERVLAAISEAREPTSWQMDLWEASA